MRSDRECIDNDRLENRGKYEKDLCQRRWKYKKPKAGTKSAIEHAFFAENACWFVSFQNPSKFSACVCASPR
jgi:hypothetical protein